MKTFLQTLFLLLLFTQICFTQWFEQNSGTTSYLCDIAFIDRNNGYSVGTNGIIIHTTDGGENWSVQESGTTVPLNSVYFTDESNGWAVEGFPDAISSSAWFWNTQVEPAIILHTTNGGLTWEKQTSGIAILLHDVCFTDKNNGIIVGGHRRNDTLECVILKTTDAGKNWITQFSDTKIMLHRVYFIDKNIGTAVGTYSDGGDLLGAIFRTTNGGSEWSKQAVGIKGVLNGVFFIDENNGVAVGTRVDTLAGLILKTTDGGNNWTNQPTLTASVLTSVFFTDDNSGTIVGGAPFDGNDVILRTADGGNTWISQPYTSTNHLSEVCFIDATNGWIVGGNGTILHTTNGGVIPVELTSFSATVNGKEVTLDWSTATELNNQGFEVQRKFGSNDFVTIGSVRGHGTTTSPNQYTFVDKLIDEGKYFFRLKQMDYDGTFEYSNEIEVEVRSVDKFTLEQNYPNPFNPTTTIGYVLQEKSNVKLTLLNSIGEEIAVLVNEEQDKGYHKVEFDGSKLSSGVYFYQLKAGSYVETKKTILLR